MVLDAPRPTTPSRALDDVYFPSEPEPEEPPIDLGELAGTYRDVNGWLGHLRVEVRAGGLVLVPLGAQRPWPIPVPITHVLAGRARPHDLPRDRVGVAVREDQATIVRRASSLG